MIIIIGEPLILPYSTAKEACNSLVKEYKDASITAEIGQLSEDIAYGLVSKLNGECFLAPKGSAMDCVLKGDIILRIGDKALVWQVKSSQKGADKHFSLARNNGFRGRRFPLPGVIVVDSEIRKVNNISKTWRIKAVCSLAKNAGVKLEKSAIKALKLYKSAKGKTIPLNKVPALDAIYTKEVCMQLTFFGLGRIEGGCNLILK